MFEEIRVLVPQIAGHTIAVYEVDGESCFAFYFGPDGVVMDTSIGW